MSNPSADFPAALHTKTDVSGYGGTALGATAKTHTQVVGKIEEELTATQEKLGSGVSSPASNTALVGSGVGTSLWRALDKSDVGLNDIDNTSDAGKPVSTAQQAALDLKQNLLEKGSPGGYASLDGGGKVPVTQLPNSIMEYKGTWNATTNIPTLADGTGNTGDVYRVAVAGAQNLGSGSITFDVGDYAVYNGATWEKSDTTDAVASVNGYTGVVNLVKGDIGLGSVDNTSDINKPVSTAQQTSLNLKANIASPTFTGAPAAPTASGGTSTTQLATTAFVTSAVSTAGATYVLKAGDTMTGALLVGAMGTTPLTVTNPVFNASGTANAAIQINIQNQSNGTSASSDIVATANTGSDSANYINMGINSSAYSDAAYTITSALDSYLYSNGGNLAIGTQSAGKQLVFHTGGTLAANERMRVADGVVTITNPNSTGANALDINTSTGAVGDSVYTRFNARGRFGYKNGFVVMDDGQNSAGGVSDGTTASKIGTFWFTNSEVARMNGITNGVNYLSFNAAITGSGPSVTAAGSDTNVPLVLASKGSANIFISTAAAIQFGTVTVSPSIIQSRNTSTIGNNMSITAQGGLSGGTNVSGGTLVLRSGISTGGATSNIQLGAYGPVSGPILTVAISSGGTGYTVGNVLTVITGGANATLTVSTVSAGVITGVTVSNAGTGYYIAARQATSGGTGTGATFSITALTGTADNSVQTVMTIRNGGASAAAVEISVPTASVRALNSSNTYKMNGDDLIAHNFTVTSPDQWSSGWLYAFSMNATANNAAGSANKVLGVYSTARLTAAGTLGTAAAYRAVLENTAGGTITAANGMEIQIYPTGAGVMSNVAGINIANWGATVGTVTNFTGVNISSLTGMSYSAFAGININAQSSATVSSTGVNIGNITGATTSRAIKTGTGQVEFGDSVAILGTSGVATHSLTLGSTATGIASYNTSDQTTNYERLLASWVSNTYVIRTDNGGTGVLRPLQIRSGANNAITFNTSGSTAFIDYSRLVASGTAGETLALFGGGFFATSGVQTVVKIAPTLTQTATAGYTALLVNPTETTTGSGAKLLADFQVGGVSKWKVRNDGVEFPVQAPTASAPTYTLGGVYFDTTLNKLRVGGATGWETVTSV